MKQRLFLTIFLAGVMLGALAQRKLSQSPSHSKFAYIYQLSADEATQLTLRSNLLDLSNGHGSYTYDLDDDEEEDDRDLINPGFLHTKIDSIRYEDIESYEPNLPPGYYLLVSAAKNGLDFVYWPVHNLRLNFINHGNLLKFGVTDLVGRLIDPSKLQFKEGRSVKYDARAKTFTAGKPREKNLIKVQYEGFTNIFLGQTSVPKKPVKTRPQAKTKVKKTTPVGETNIYKGYMVFNKPKYKPLDTVKFKAYLLSGKGKDLKGKPLRAELTQEYYGKAPAGKVIGMIAPYRNGAYEYSFVLADSLQPRLDNRYHIVLREEVKGKWVKAYSGAFYYEDYELKSVNFSVRTNKSVYSPGSPVVAYLKAVDENELAVPDGRVKIQVLSSYAEKYGASHLFIKDTLWTTELAMDPVGETKLVIPDSIFPKANLSVQLQFQFLNSNNEKREASKYVRYVAADPQYKGRLVNDSLLIEYLLNDSVTRQAVRLYTDYVDRKGTEPVLVQLPLKIKLNPQVEQYVIRSTESSAYAEPLARISLQQLYPAINLEANQTKDSLTVAVSNPHKVPFWYTAYTGKSVLFSGYGSGLDTALRLPSDKIATVNISYVWGGLVHTDQAEAGFNQDRINVKLDAPRMVYPGQEVNMQVNLTDYLGRPVPQTDVTALAYTTKFGFNSLPALPGFHTDKPLKSYPPTKSLMLFGAEGEAALDWEKLGKQLQLDTAQYFRFVNTKDRYLIEEDYADSMAVVAPFAVANGAIQPAHIVYIDEIPVFFSQTNQLQRYAFRVKPGRHSIRIRTLNRTIADDNVTLKAGKKTIISFSADTTNQEARVVSRLNTLTDNEAAELMRYMVRVHDNFRGRKTIISADGMETSYYTQLSPGVPPDKLLGPYRGLNMDIRSDSSSYAFSREWGYTYTFKPGLIKQKSYGSTFGFEPELNRVPAPAFASDYKQYPLRKGDVDSIWNELLNQRSRVSPFFQTFSFENVPRTARLLMNLDSSVTKGRPYVKNLLIYQPGNPDFIQNVPGNYINDVMHLPAGRYNAVYIFQDNSFFEAKDIDVPGHGTSYRLWNNQLVIPQNELTSAIDSLFKTASFYEDRYSTVELQQRILGLLYAKDLPASAVNYTIKGRVLDADTKLPLADAGVQLFGIGASVKADQSGYFTLKGPNKGHLLFTHTGYLTKYVPIRADSAMVILLKEVRNGMNEVVVRGYTKRSREQTTGSSYTVSGAEIGAPGLKGSVGVRGLNVVSPPPAGLPGNSLIIVNNLPYQGRVEDIPAESIATLNVLRGAEATTIYGSAGKNGVILITTVPGASLPGMANTLEPQKPTLRTRFSDYAFWQPRLLTDDRGIARFKVRFPDDITSWSAQVIAINGRKQSGMATETIKSFKSLSANLVSPSFAVSGDSLSMIGKLMNYNSFTEQVQRRFSYNGNPLMEGNVDLKNAWLDTVKIVAQMGMQRSHPIAADSLSFEYSMQQENGYFDGELRKIPLLPKGTTETSGVFDVLNRDTSVSYTFDAGLGKITLRAEASVFPVLLDEIDKLRNYEYLCNEQMASKLKALLLEKAVRKYLGETFREDPNISMLLKKLHENKKPQGTWGWWRDSQEEIWISLHVVEALLMAEKAGYPIQLDRMALYAYFQNTIETKPIFQQIQILKLMMMLDNKPYTAEFISRADKQVSKRSIPLQEALELMLLKQKAGLDIDIKWLLNRKKQTMFGASYWGSSDYAFWDNSIQNTLLAYRILKGQDGYAQELDRIIRYFLEQRKEGQWRNTYESSLILETILPDLMMGGQKPVPPAIVLNKTETVNVFPYTKTFEASKLTVDHKGTTPVYLTAFQQFNNPDPDKRSKDFTVNTSMLQGGTVVKSLKAGTSTTLRVEVEVRADADYVMIEVPIPAGCSYESKPQNYWGAETHREYFKHKTSIFCTKLRQGKYTFNIQLLPRYSGVYTLNPAKAEMMYFPVFYGREGMKKVSIQ